MIIFAVRVLFILISIKGIRYEVRCELFFFSLSTDRWWGGDDEEGIITLAAFFETYLTYSFQNPKQKYWIFFQI